jgi:cytochrome c oxidase cbb3-type subunit 4|tara:strand:+ start:371 stop:562 length:192 start_codon:yes stop_codon:yes gene_type:complete
MNSEIYLFLREFWVVWLMAIFIGIFAYAFWPSRARKAQMQEHANIPFRDDAKNSSGKKDRGDF